MLTESGASGCRHAVRREPGFEVATFREIDGVIDQSEVEILNKSAKYRIVHFKSRQKIAKDARITGV
ncbi:hypothetical protein [Methylobacterium aerolatum]|uniref:Uncharacterized protein n=1 Tax=Methylobacterium aerolatum TaxID=418708 RepID=A0ABU0I6C5_9HYPH|nr:hypothetical protein [Methylobacterium aerolatum]MDQ0449246.1 hypothetical protein [Methylobacterium aerolatum]